MSYIRNNPALILDLLREHLVMVGSALLISVLIALPLSLLLVSRPRLASGVMGVLGALYTIPSIALLIQAKDRQQQNQQGNARDGIEHTEHPHDSAGQPRPADQEQAQRQGNQYGDQERTASHNQMLTQQI